MARMDSSEEKAMISTNMNGMMQHREKAARITWMTASVPGLTALSRSFLFLVKSLASRQNRLESMVLAPRMQIKPSTFCKSPAAELRLMSPVTMNAR